MAGNVGLGFDGGKTGSTATPYPVTDAVGGAALGAPADSAWASGSGTVIALLKTIATALSSVLPVQIFRSDSFINITTKTTTVVKASAGVLCKIVINKTGATDTLAIYDNTAGSGTLVGTITAPLVGQVFAYEATMGTGITIVSGGGTAGDYTVIFR